MLATAAKRGRSLDSILQNKIQSNNPIISLCSKQILYILTSFVHCTEYLIKKCHLIKNIYLPQHHAQFFHMDSHLAFQVLSKHLTLKVDFL